MPPCAFTENCVCGRLPTRCILYASIPDGIRGRRECDVGKRNWSWNSREARRTNGFGNPVDRAPAVRDSDGRVMPEWRRPAILPPDLRQQPDDPHSPHHHAENFPNSVMWAHYFDGWQDPVRCARLDDAVREGACVALGGVAGVYSVESVLAQVYGARR